MAATETFPAAFSEVPFSLWLCAYITGCSGKVLACVYRLMSRKPLTRYPFYRPARPNGCVRFLPPHQPDTFFIRLTKFRGMQTDAGFISSCGGIVYFS
ncbi:hypothetical protein [Pantoea graminicola]|uniref:hypothetical protein n=1 Tax=Pantoea sp. ARC607 TaxID=2027922 RepID=UPI0011B3F1EF|nr:hypothetical protein [Pantoea sp. ARC607]